MKFNESSLFTKIPIILSSEPKVLNQRVKHGSKENNKIMLENDHQMNKQFYQVVCV